MFSRLAGKSCFGASVYTVFSFMRQPTISGNVWRDDDRIARSGHKLSAVDNNTTDYQYIETDTASAPHVRMEDGLAQPHGLRLRNPSLPIRHGPSIVSLGWALFAQQREDVAKSLLGAVYDARFLLIRGNTRGHRPRLQSEIREK
jgi:hypothetical protein